VLAPHHTLDTGRDGLHSPHGRFKLVLLLLAHAHLFLSVIWETWFTLTPNHELQNPTFSDPNYAPIAGLRQASERCHSLASTYSSVSAYTDFGV